MTDAELLRTAIDASGIVTKRTQQPSTRAFAIQVLEMNDANARKVLEGKKHMSRAARVLCMLVVMDPSLVETIILAVAQVRAEMEEGETDRLVSPVGPSVGSDVAAGG